MHHILLVEDNPGEVLLFREALRLAAVDADLLVAYDGEEASTYLGRQHFDFVILDLDIGKMHGHVILQEYAGVERSPAFIVFSNSRLETDKQQALILGAKDYIVKPSEIESFIQTVTRMLSDKIPARARQDQCTVARCRS